MPGDGPGGCPHGEHRDIRRDMHRGGCYNMSGCGHRGSPHDGRPDKRGCDLSGDPLCGLRGDQPGVLPDGGLDVDLRGGPDAGQLCAQLSGRLCGQRGCLASVQPDDPHDRADALHVAVPVPVQPLDREPDGLGGDQPVDPAAPDAARVPDELAAPDSRGALVWLDGPAGVDRSYVFHVYRREHDYVVSLRRDQTVVAGEPVDVVRDSAEPGRDHGRRVPRVAFRPMLRLEQELLSGPSP
ncbi:hypothetical protein QWY75_06190 [Pontixanthobacter aestiaquae]|uniref:hypothetical protein n=1 Tax=Pontixanthobacter aestiaquae TaxID=1509367 RepID=UPI0019259B8B|nr:hypothetical protein [Pontixanthobacter aestiaquae]MDN3645790.1 hypothetical protein [Pontixanthobacter aestiaquae]